MNNVGPLDGVRVVELAGLAPAPFGCMILADLGADVLRVDRGGDNQFAIVPPAGPLDRGRRSVAIDLKQASGVQALLRIIEAADVFVEGFRPGVAERLGIGPEVLLERNPRLVYARMTGWGQGGPLAQRAGHDINYIALSGALEPIGRAGEAPHAPLNILGDFAGGGMLMTLGILAALHERHTSGQGQVIDAAMVDGSNLLMTFLHGMKANGLWEGDRGTNILDGAAPFYDTYECADGRYVAVGCVEFQFYQQLLAGLDIDEEAEGLAFQLDSGGWPQARAVIAARFKQRSRDEWADLFVESDACVTPVLTPWEAHEHAHNQARTAYIEIEGVRQPAPAPRFSRTPAAHPRALDQEGRDPRAALREWGIADGEFDSWGGAIH
ncbi:MAG: CaiB/BaiF CoA-transferase family protein [Propionibacteriales bacterium]|nr:CaiB/BaiF CoA-transferase family protein [Propionibacteriales bacterium]